MAPTSTALTTRPATGSPYQLDPAQLRKASTALLAHIKSESKKSDSSNGTKRNLLAAAADGSHDDEENDEDDTPIWLILTTKKHVTDKTRLKPGKIPLPHSLNTSPNLTICLITADPQRPFKDLIADSSFATPLRNQITRVIGVSKLRSRYKTFETKRQLLSEHDVFLADDRVVTMLPGILGKVFYAKAAKRPIPVCLTGKKDKDAKAAAAITPPTLAAEVTRAVGAALVYLSPSTCTSVKVAKASWPVEKVHANAEKVIEGLVEKYVPGGWRGVRGVHLKGEKTAALPVWLADELWAEEGDVLEVVEGEDVKEIEGGKKQKLISAPKSTTEGGKKRKRGPRGKGVKKAEGEATEEAEGVSKKARKDTGEGDDLAEEIKQRKLRLQLQKTKAKGAVDGAAEAEKSEKADRAKKGKKGKKSAA